MLQGNLIPLSPWPPPFNIQCDAKSTKTGNEEEVGVGVIRNRKRPRRRAVDDDDDHGPIILQPLKVPGNFGREELLRPFSKACPICSRRGRRRHGVRRHRGNTKNHATSPIKNNTTIDSSRPPSLCNICQSIQSMAKFIPRKDFLSFSNYNNNNGRSINMNDDNSNDYVVVNKEKKNEGLLQHQQLQLAISGRNAHQLVRICSFGGTVRESITNRNNNNSYQNRNRSSTNPQEYSRKFLVQDGDTISLLWFKNNGENNGGEDGGDETTTTKLDNSISLLREVRFRLAIIKGEEDEDDAVDVAVGRELPDNRVVVPVRVEDKAESQFEAKEKHCENNDHSEMDHLREEKKEGHVPIQKQNHPREKNATCNNEDDSSLDDETFLWNVGGYLKPNTEKRNVVVQKSAFARGNYFRDTRAKYHGGGVDRLNKKQKQLQQQPTTNDVPSDSLRFGSSWALPAPCGEEETSSGARIINKSKKSVEEEEVEDVDEEEDSESAPLTLPSQFLAAKSFSFDSTTEQPSHRRRQQQQQHSKSSMENNTEHDIRQHHKIQRENETIGSKRVRDDIIVEATIDQGKGAAKTPKKSNVTNADAKTITSSSTPISSLSYDQLVRLQEDTNPSSNNNSTITQQPSSKPASSSLRHAVLSLTLALTSNASSWDSNFIKGCNTLPAAVIEHPNHRTMTGVNKLEHYDLGIMPPMARQAAKERWMPRLLRGTRVILRKEDECV